MGSQHLPWPSSSDPNEGNSRIFSAKNAMVQIYTAELEVDMSSMIEKECVTTPRFASRQIDNIA